MRIVLDTNLIVRAAGDRGGLARELLDRTLGETHTLVLSHLLFAEVEKVLHYPRLRALHGWDDADIRRFLDFLIAGSEQVKFLSFPVGPLVGLDPKDDMVLLTAMAGRADVLATRNRHFFATDVMQFAARHDVRILDDLTLLAELRSY